MVRFIDLHEIYRQQLYRKWKEGCDPKEAFEHVFGGVNSTSQFSSEAINHIINIINKRMNTPDTHGYH